MTKLWIRTYGGDDCGFPSRDLAGALTDAGIELHPPDVDCPDGPGLLHLSALDDGLFEKVRTVSRDGRERVVAVADPGMALDQNTVWRILEAGASDICVFTTPAESASYLAARFERWSEIERLVDDTRVAARVVGTSQAWRDVLRQVVAAARFTDAGILLLGESGTGKELIARLIDDLDPRADKPELVILDCSTITAELSGSEFFGHERGAFTGAVSLREGAFGLAHGGTLFLDEVGELPIVLQAKLLRVIQEHAYKRVGGNAWQQTRFRLVTATNRDLTREVARGAFREDLYFRIAGCVIRLPPLRERREDIIPLALRFFAEESGGRDPSILDDSVRDYLLGRDYPGNVRDLRQVVKRIAHRHVGLGPITAGDIPEGDRPSSGTRVATWNGEPFENAIRYAISLGMGLRDISQAAAETAIRLAMQDEQGNLQRAARRLGVTDRALQMRRAGQRSRQDAPDDGCRVDD
jgi:transcriptional regulator with GAF, ATPase, and Fis domain